MNEPDRLVWLLALIPVAALMFLRYKQRFLLISRLISGAPSALNAGGNGASLLRTRYVFSSVFFLLFLGAQIAALADPRMGSRLVREFQRGCDVVLAMDISRSMNVRDAASMPDSGDEAGKNASTRLERSRWIARNLVEGSGDSAVGGSVFLRFGLAIGKGRGVLAVPVSSDGEAVLAVLDALSSSTMNSWGTNLERLLDAAGNGFLEDSPAGRQIVLFTDGEGLEGSLFSSMERLMRDDVSVIAVGLGSAQGALIPENGDAPSGGENVLVRSFLRADALKSAVERGGGAYIDGNRDDAVNLIAEKIFPLAENSSWVFREESGALWHIFVVAGMVFLLLSMAAKKSARTTSLPG
ncbi:MAG: VWA domain-containing protein [Spirochaetaceae bacterium]|nr:VWA domain-containing protein [Spirochaetaceae bacterium]